MNEKHALSVDFTADPDVPVNAGGIYSLLFHSVRELLFNVVKHSGVDKAIVSIRKVKGALKTVVADHGAGFDAAAAKKAAAETGFGLQSIRERISLLDGEMNIESAPGKGTRITLTIPLNGLRLHPAIAEAAVAASAVRAIAEDLGSTGKIRVLIADDHRIVREGLTKLIQAEPDMDVAGEASDGEEAVDKARDLSPDVIIMDMSMPRLSGLEATRKIITEMPGICVIGLSMCNKEDREEPMLMAGASAYFTKDGPSNNLLAAIRAAKPAFTREHYPT